MKQTVRIRNAAPVYACAAVWPVGVFLLRLHGLAAYLGMAVISVLVFLAGRKIWPDRMEEVEIPDPEPSDPELAALKQDRDRAVSEFRRLNDGIADETISRQISRMESTAQKIFDVLLQHPEQKNAARTFLNYYLPTTLKLLNEYDRMDQLGVSGQNIDRSKQKIEGTLEMICAAFDRQLDALYSDTAMDISADVAVLEQLLQQEERSGGM